MIPSERDCDHRGEGLRVAETHISVLFFVGERVYKLHKPVRYGFLDFTERSAREADCHREVELNRRLAPDVYLGVADLSMDGELIDHLVVMRALPPERKLTALVRNSSELGPWLDRVAARLASFHAQAGRSEAIAQAGSPQARRTEWEANFAEMDPFVGPILDTAVDGEIQATVRNWLTRNEALLECRVQDGHVCDGHGDLQADDIFCLDDGIRILDCLEFSDALRYGDVCAMWPSWSWTSSGSVTSRRRSRAGGGTVRLGLRVERPHGATPFTPRALCGVAGVCASQGRLPPIRAGNRRSG